MESCPFVTAVIDEDSAARVLPTVRQVVTGKNRYGLDMHYFKEKLSMICRDMDSFTPDELSRALRQLSITAEPL